VYLARNHCADILICQLVQVNLYEIYIWALAATLYRDHQATLRPGLPKVYNLAVPNNPNPAPKQRKVGDKIRVSMQMHSRSFWIHLQLPGEL
jgi:hypothetical protein